MILSRKRAGFISAKASTMIAWYWSIGRVMRPGSSRSTLRKAASPIRESRPGSAADCAALPCDETPPPRSPPRPSALRMYDMASALPIISPAIGERPGLSIENTMTSAFTSAGA